MWRPLCWCQTEAPYIAYPQPSLSELFAPDAALTLLSFLGPLMSPLPTAIATMQLVTATWARAVAQDTTASTTGKAGRRAEVTVLGLASGSGLGLGSGLSRVNTGS